MKRLILAAIGLIILAQPLRSQTTNNNAAAGCIASRVGTGGLNLMIDLCRKVPSNNTNPPAPPTPVTYPLPGNYTNNPIITIITIYIRGIFAMPIINRLVEEDPWQAVDISSAGFTDPGGNPITTLTWARLETSTNLTQWKPSLSITCWWSAVSCLAGFYSNGVAIGSSYGPNADPIPIDLGSGREPVRFFRMVRL